MTDMAYIVIRMLEDKIAIAKNTNQNIIFVTLNVLDEILALLKDFALLKEQPEIIQCKDCKWYDERISMCDNCGLPRERTFFCADGKHK